MKKFVDFFVKFNVWLNFVNIVKVFFFCIKIYVKYMDFMFILFYIKYFK